MAGFFKICGFVVMLVMLAGVPVRAQILDDDDGIEDPVTFNMIVNDVVWWEEIATDHVLPDMAITLHDEAAARLADAAGNDVGGQMMFYFDDKFITTFQIMDSMSNGVVRFRYDHETQSRLQPLLPSLAGRKKPVVRMIKAR